MHVFCFYRIACSQQAGDRSFLIEGECALLKQRLSSVTTKELLLALKPLRSLCNKINQKRARGEDFHPAVIEICDMVV